MRNQVTASTAAKMLGVTRLRVERLAEQGHLGVLSLPGMNPRYCLADVIRLRDRCTKPASVSADAELVEA